MNFTREPDVTSSGAPGQADAEITPLPDAAERHKVLVEWNNTRRDYPREKCIHDLFREQAARTPDAIALEEQGERLTYGRLTEISDHLARHLRGLGVKPGELVGMSIERSFERIIALLGILKAGANYWALEENLPEERLAYLVNDARPGIILATEASRGSLHVFHDVTKVVVITELLASPAADDIPLECPLSPGEAAYVSYTSGSTGKPKGVVVPHRGVVRLVKGTDYVNLDEREVLLHMSPLSFDASTFEIWGALLNGGKVVILPPGQPSLAEIAAAIQHHEVSTLWLTAGLFHLMVDEQIHNLSPLRQLLAGGDVLCPKRVMKVRETLPRCRVINGYGPTENTTFTCCHTVGDGSELTPAVPIGRPIANTTVYVLDQDLQPVSVGVPGELYVGGDGVAIGYLNQPEMTARSFIPDPFSQEPGARLYKTGDRVAWRPDGAIDFLGRMDNQVKIRGFRVELGEIEAELRGCPGIREAAVVIREDVPGYPVLVGYIVPAEGSSVIAAETKAGLRERLPEYMVPSHLVTLDHIPLSSSGKLDRKNLPAPEAGVPDLPPEPNQEPIKEANGPADRLQLELTEIWERLFHRRGIRRDQNFFDLGGHSLLAARLASEIEKAFDVKLPIAVLLQSPTIESLAMRLVEENWTPRWSSIVPLQKQGNKAPLFLVHGWGGDVYVFLDLAKQFAPDRAVYGIQAIGLDGKEGRHTSVEAMAAHYVKEMLSVQPEGPYHLGGYSLGGIITYEIARQLRELGHEVDLLALLDSYPIGPIPRMAYARTVGPYLIKRTVHHFTRMCRMPHRERMEYFNRRLIELRNRMTRNRDAVDLPDSVKQPEADTPVVPGFGDYYHALAAAYRMSHYNGPAHVFVSGEADPLEVESWRHIIRGRVAYHKIPGGHFEILDSENVPAMAEALKSAMESPTTAGSITTRGILDEEWFTSGSASNKHRNAPLCDSFSPGFPNHPALEDEELSRS